MIEFQGFPKIPRLFRDMVVTEKIDGTNACVVIRELGDNEVESVGSCIVYHGDYNNEMIFEVAAQSRNRLITREEDNYGFAAWVADHAAWLVPTLGPGRHYGEWWGQGIQRGYGLTEKRFSLFNVSRWAELHVAQVPGLHVVPTLYHGEFSEARIVDLMDDLYGFGSQAVKGFMNPEGVVVYHTASGQLFKALLENDAQPKNLVGALQDSLDEAKVARELKKYLVLAA